MEEKTKKVAVKPSKTKYPLDKVFPFIDYGKDYRYVSENIVSYNDIYFDPKSVQIAPVIVPNINVYPTYYYVSNVGQVFGYSGNPLKLEFDTGGYYYIKLSTYNGTRILRVHRLVMLAFCYDPRYIGFDVDHINGNKTQNYFNLRIFNFKTRQFETKSNLRWVTKRENYLASKTEEQINYNTNYYVDPDDGISKPYSKPKKRNKRLTDDEVHYIWKLSKEGYNTNYIRAITGTPQSTIKDIIYGNTHKDIAKEYNFINESTSNKLTDPWIYYN